MRKKVLLITLLKRKTKTKTSNDCVNENCLEYVKSISPKTNQKRSLFHAFWVGGVICMIGQTFRFILELWEWVKELTEVMKTSIILV